MGPTPTPHPDTSAVFTSPLSVAILGSSCRLNLARLNELNGLGLMGKTNRRRKKKKPRSPSCSSLEPELWFWS